MVHATHTPKLWETRGEVGGNVLGFVNIIIVLLFSLSLLNPSHSFLIFIFLLKFIFKFHYYNVYSLFNIKEHKTNITIKATRIQKIYL